MTREEIEETFSVILNALQTMQGDPDFLPLPVEEYVMHTRRVYEILEMCLDVCD